MRSNGSTRQLPQRLAHKEPRIRRLNGQTGIAVNARHTAPAPAPADPEVAFKIALRESWEKDLASSLSLEERLQRDRLRRQAGEDLLRDLIRKRNEAHPPPLYSPRIHTPAYAPPLPPRNHHTHLLQRNPPPPLPPRRRIPR